MGHLFFYLAVVAACLLWSAAFTAAAARSRPGWIRWLLVAVAVIVPVLALAPWVGLTAILAFGVGLDANWFAPTLTACLAALIGGAWIARAGLAPRAAPTAATWPLIGLAAMFVMAKAVAAGTLLLIDNAVAAEGRMLQVEAAQIMATALPPAPATDDNAAPLYQRAFAALAADQSVGEPASLLQDPLTADVASPDAAALLERHTATLDLLRRATDRPAFGLATLGALADCADGMTASELLRSVPEEPTRFACDGPFSFLYRCFMLPSDIAGYRDIMGTYQAVVGTLLLSKPQRYPAVVEETAEIEEQLRSR